MDSFHYNFVYDKNGTDIADLRKRIVEKGTLFEMMSGQDETDNSFELSVVPRFKKDFSRGAALLYAKSIGNLRKATLVHSDGVEELIYDADWEETEFTNQTEPEFLGRDVLTLISSRLGPVDKTKLQRVAKQYAKNVSPTKWDVKTKGISQVLYRNLRDYYSPQEIFELFIRFPNVAETCVNEDAAILTTGVGSLSLYTLFTHAPPTTISLCEFTEAWNTAAMVIVKDGKELDYIQDPRTREELNSAILDKLVNQDIIPLECTLSPEKQWEILLSANSTEKMRKLIEVYGFNTFSLNEENILNAARFDSKVVSYLSTVNGIEKDFVPPMFIFSDTGLDKAILTLLLNPFLYPEKLIVEFLKAYLLLGEGQQLPSLLACIVVLNEYDISSIADISSNLLINPQYHALNILRCGDFTKPVIDAIEKKYIEGERFEPYVKIKADELPEDIFESVDKYLEEEATDNELSNIVREYKNRDFYILAPKRLENSLLDLLASSSETPKARLHFDKPDSEEYTTILLSRLADVFPLSSVLVDINSSSKEFQAQVPKLLENRFKEMVKKLQDDIFYGKVVLKTYQTINVGKDFTRDNLRDFKEFIEKYNGKASLKDGVITVTTVTRDYTNYTEKYYNWYNKVIGYNIDKDSKEYGYVLLCFKDKKKVMKDTNLKMFNKNRSHTLSKVYYSGDNAFILISDSNVQDLLKYIAANYFRVKLVPCSTQLPKELQRKDIYIVDDNAKYKKNINESIGSLKYYISIPQDVIKKRKEGKMTIVSVPEFILEETINRLRSELPKEVKVHNGEPSKTRPMTKKKVSSSSEEEVKPKKTFTRRASPTKKVVSSSSEEEVKPKKTITRRASPIKKKVVQSSSDEDTSSD